MASRRELELVIKAIDQSSKTLDRLSANLGQVQRTISDINKQARLDIDTDKAQKGLSETNRKVSELDDNLETAGKQGSSNLLLIAAAFGGIATAIQVAIGAAQRFYALSIGQNERLNQQLLQNAASIEATSQIKVSDNLVEGIDAVKALQPALRDALLELEIRTEKISGATDQQVRTAFDAVIGRVALLNGQSEQFGNSIESATALATKLTAALASNNLNDTTQIYQEIGDILTGDITADSDLARRLQLDRETIQNWQAQGQLVDNLIDRLAVYEDTANLAANSITNVTSNFQSLFERIGRESSADLLEPVSTVLNAIFNFLQDNEDAIVENLKIIFENIGNIVAALGDALSPLARLGDEGASISKLLVDSFKAFEAVVVGLSPAVKILIEGLIDGIEQLAEAGDQFRQVFAFVTGGLENSNQAVEALGQASDSAAASTINLLTKIKSVGDASAETQGQVKALATEQIAANEAQIEELRKFVPASEAQRKGIEARISSLESLNEQLQINSAELASNTNQVEISGKPLKELGDTYEQLAQQVKNAQRQISTATDSQTANKAAGDLIKLTQQELELGRATQEEAQTRLLEITKDTRISYEQQSAAAEQYRKIAASGSDARIKGIQAERAELEASLADEEQLTVDQIRKIAGLRNQEAQARIANIQSQIAAEQQLIDAGAGSSRTLDSLKTELRTIQAETVKAAAQTEKEIRQARLTEVERTAAELEKVQIDAQRNVFRTEQQLRQRRATDAAFTEEQLQAQLAAIQLKTEQSRIAQDIQLQQQRVAIFREGTQERIAAENRLFQLQLEAEKQLAREKEVSRQAAVAEVSARIEGAQELQQFEQKRLELLQRGEDLILASLETQKSLYDTQLATAQAIQGLQIATAQAESKQLQDAIALRREEVQIRERLRQGDLAREERDALEARRKAIRDELRLLGVRGQSEKQLQRELFEAERERIERERAAVEFQQSAAQAQLEFEIQREQIAAQRRIRDEQNRQAELQFQRTLLQLEAEKARGDGNERAAAAAERGIAQLDKQIGLQAKAIQQSREEAAQQTRIAEERRKELKIQQAAEDIAAQERAAADALGLARDADEGTQRRARRFARGEQQELQRELDAGKKLADSSERASTGLDALNANLQSTIETAANNITENWNDAATTVTDAFVDAADAAKTAFESAFPAPESRDVGGAIQAGRPYQLHPGEIVVSGAASRAQAMRFAGSGSYVGRGAFHRPATDGYVLTRSDVGLLGLTAGLINRPAQAVRVASTTFDDGNLLGALTGQTGLLDQLVNLARQQTETLIDSRRQSQIRRFAGG